MTHDHVAQQRVHGRKHQLTGVLVSGGTFRALLEWLGAQHAFAGTTNHHREGTAWDKAVKDLTEHRGLLGQMRGEGLEFT